MTLLSVAAQDALAATLIEEGTSLLDGMGGGALSLAQLDWGAWQEYPTGPAIDPGEVDDLLVEGGVCNTGLANGGAPAGEAAADGSASGAG